MGVTDNLVKVPTRCTSYSTPLTLWMNSPSDQVLK